MNYSAYSIKGLRESFKKKHFSSENVVKDCLRDIKENKLNAFITICENEAVRKAKEADKKIKEGIDLPLLGIPVSIKDMYLTRGVKTTAASKVLDDYIPQYSATAVKRLENSGAIIIGKTNSDAWAHGSSGENSDYGPTENFFLEDYVPGGSSSGSAVSVSGDIMCFASMGTDTGGSIRLPASFCDVVGLKPTYGRVSRYGVIAMASSLDCIGHLTRYVDESALILSITSGKDPKDATSVNKKVDDYESFLNKKIKGIRIGLPNEYFTEGLDERIKERIEKRVSSLEERGAKIEYISLPNTKHATACYYIIQPAEVSSNLARYDGIRYGNDRTYFGDEAKRRIMLGTYVLSSGYYDAYYKKAMQVRTLIKRDFDEAFKKVDVIITPVSPTLPWRLGDKVSDPLEMYLSDVYTVTANLAGIPGLSIPVGLIDGLPVGMQILGPHFSEGKLFQVGKAIEDSGL